ncbi:MAG TPA: ParB/RepB/Spo0J family partition protein, partial [Roseiflexaceae bacterium]|nr:ParB/RepB/Spo0J family partition protein [Roseiflexaceae bacterium]
MATRRRGGLGSGLDALFSAGSEPTASLREVPIEQIHPNPRQPRTEFEEQALLDLASSIKEHGVIQPLVVSQTSPGRYELIAGERRWRAARQAGLAQVPILVREAAPQQILELALIENVQRADLNALEEARAYQTLADEFGLSDNEIARRLGKTSREAIANTRRLLQLVPEAQAAVLRGTITAGHGRALLMIKD